MFTPVETRRASDEIIEQIRAQLERGALRSGDRLASERELAEAFAVSRNTVREALRALERMGLLRLRKGASGGAFISDRVAPALASAIGDLYSLGLVTPEHLAEARTVVGTAAARLACERASTDALERLVACVRTATEAGKAGDLGARSAANFEFHRLLAEAAGNPILVILTEAISDINRRFAEAAGPPPNRVILPGRRRLLKHILARDGEQAAREIAAQIRAVEGFYAKALGERRSRTAQSGQEQG